MENVKFSPSISGAASALLGLGAGYALAPHKYTLERLLMQDKDSFERTFSEDVMKSASKAEKESLNKIKEASSDYFQLGKKLRNEKISPNAKVWASMVSKIEVDDSFVKEVSKSKDAYIKALNDSNYKDLKIALNTAQEKAFANPKDVSLNLEMKDAAKKFADAQLAVEPFAKKYRKAREVFRNARDEAMLKLPDRGLAISAQWDKVRRAMSERANLMYEKLSTLSKSNALSKDYALVKKYIPKARTTSSLAGGIIAGLGGVVAGVYSVNKFHNT